MARPIALADRPLAGQVLAQTLLLGAAYAPLIFHLFVQVSAYFYLVVLLRVASLRWPGLTPGRWLLLPLTVAGGLVVLDAYRGSAGHAAGTGLLAIMLALKLLETKRVRDVRLGTLFFGFLLIAQFLFDQSPWLTMYLGALLVGNFALMTDLSGPSGQRRALGALLLAGRLTLQALPLALVFFLLFPRLSVPLWNVSGDDTIGVSGIRPMLEPGVVGELLLDDSLALRARFDGPSPPKASLYWRGPVLWETDGRRWLPGKLGESSDGPTKPARIGDRVGYTMLLEPNGQHWVFALDLPLQAPSGTRITADFEVLTRGRVDEVIGYRMESALAYDTGPLDPERRSAALALPGTVTERMRLLASRWADTSRNGRELVERGLAWVNREPFHYTLSPPLLGARPDDEFLFESRRGFCEHYASGFALLMRSAGIPARVVLGYTGGELNPLGGYLMVRQADAHAWVEVWLEGEGWVRVDPTAAIAPERVESGASIPGRREAGIAGAGSEGVDEWLRGGLRGLALLADAVDARWRLWVIGYGLERQQRLLDAVGLGFLAEYGLALAMMVSVSVVLGLLLVAMTGNRSRRDPAVRLYDRLCRRLARVGLERRPSEGPMDYAQRVGASRPELSGPVRDFIESYIALRYGAASGPGAVRMLRERLKDVRPG
jgi:transglutaminase-like putative cysteine protease